MLVVVVGLVSAELPRGEDSRVRRPSDPVVLFIALSKRTHFLAFDAAPLLTASTILVAASNPGYHLACVLATMGKKGAVRIKQVGPKPGGAGAGVPPSALLNPMESFMPPAEELADLKIPDVPSDRGYKVFWPLHETLSMDTKKFRCIYPSYIDSTKTLQRGGRRLPLELCVSNPTVSDLSEALRALMVRHVVQPYKVYPRGGPEMAWENPGRVYVDLTRYGNSKALLMREVAARIPTLPSRIDRLNHQEQERAERERQKAEYLQQQQKHQQPSSAGASSSSSSAKTKKKGGGGKHQHGSTKHRR
jgi:signal recognition particle subunit SEC65